MTKDYFGVFVQVNLPVNTWPYFREFVHSTVSRMGLPPVVLPLVKRG
jgi:preprotein translocase subunit SecB